MAEQLIKITTCNKIVGEPRLIHEQFKKMKEEMKEVGSILASQVNEDGSMQYATRAHLVEECLDLMTATQTMIQGYLAPKLETSLEEFCDFVKEKNRLRGYVEDAKVVKKATSGKCKNSESLPSNS